MPSPIQIISELPPDHPGFDLSSDASATSEAAIAALLRAEDTHFWYLSRNRIILDRLRTLGLGAGARVIDLGCGAGSVAAFLARQGFCVTGVEGHRPLLEIAARRSDSLTLFQHDLGRGSAGLPGSGYDAACLFEVLEHLDDPAAALRQALELVAPGGLVVGTVPALMSLWSGIDARAGHKLRYTRRGLRALLSSVPGAIVEVAPFNRVLVPFLWLQRLVVGRRADMSHAIQNLSVPPAPVNAAFGAAVMLEHRLSRVLDRTPIEGASLWFAIRKGRDEPPLPGR